eukprot:FR741889.1.p1 GENE.FR741889.1~~FR741889.1.p1  ORF type:complete len:282 (+),score=4.53 FR741889.1:104-847(+)
MELPLNMFVSVGARGRSGVIVSAVDLQSGVSISVVEVSAPYMFATQSLSTYGPYETMDDIGKSDLISNLLIRQRDGDLERPVRLGATDLLNSKSEGPALALSATTTTSQGVSGSLGGNSYNPCLSASGGFGKPKCDDEEESRRVAERAKENSLDQVRQSKAVAILLPSGDRWRGGADGRILVLWASMAGVWGNSASALALDRALCSFRVRLDGSDSWIAATAASGESVCGPLGGLAGEVRDTTTSLQ